MRPLTFSAFVAFLVACSSAPPSDEVTAATRSPLTEVDGLSVRIQRIAYTGDLCPAGTLLGAGDSPADFPNDAFTLVTSQSTLDGQAAPVAKTCQIAIDLQIPAGYQMGIPVARTSGFVQGDGHIFFGTEYAWSGARGARASVTDLTGRNADYVVTDEFHDGPWSPTCGDAHVAHLVVDVAAAVIGADTLFTYDALDAGLAYRDGLDFRRCGEHEPLQAPPGEAREYCGGMHARACVGGLDCEYALERGLADRAEGECIDPSEKLPPQPSQSACGGVRAIACQAGLTCMYSSQKAIDERHTGICTPSVGGAGDWCEGVPEIPCAAGLVCNGAVCAAKK
jgi:hypothetical protein